MAIGSPQWMYKSGEAYEIEQSLKFEDGRTPYLTKTFASAGNRNTFTWSLWLKKAKGGTTFVFGGADNNNAYRMRLESSNKIVIYDYDGSSNQFQFKLETSALYRDHSAWYHIVFAFDSTQGTNTNRAKLYVNGSQITAFSSASYPSQNYNSNCNC